MYVVLTSPFMDAESACSGRFSAVSLKDMLTLFMSTTMSLLRHAFSLCILRFSNHLSLFYPTLFTSLGVLDRSSSRSPFFLPHSLFFVLADKRVILLSLSFPSLSSPPVLCSFALLSSCFSPRIDTPSRLRHSAASFSPLLLPLSIPVVSFCLSLRPLRVSIRYGLPGSPGCEKALAPSCGKIPPGWDRWLGLLGNSKYYNYGVSRDGTIEQHGEDYATDYFPDLVANYTVDFIYDSAKNHPDQPILAVNAWPTPHGPHTPYAPKGKQ